MNDVNLYSYNGPDYDGHSILIDAESVGLKERHVTWTNNPVTGALIVGHEIYWADTLKFSTGLADCNVQAGRVYGGKEDCADFNNKCHNIQLKADSFHSGGKYVTTIKGGCTGIDIRGEIECGGSEVDHDYGNWSDQSNAKTTGNILGTWKADGSPVTVRCLNADKPMVVPGTGPYRYLFPRPDAFYHGIVVWLFLTTRRLKLWK